MDNPKRTTNISNHYSSTIGKKTQAKIKYSHKNYADYLTNEKPNSFFLSPTDKGEFKLILSSQDISKEPVLIVCQLLKKDISDQLNCLKKIFLTNLLF